MFAPRFVTVDTGEVSLNVAVAGDGDRPLVVLLHGFPEYWAAWREVMERLAEDFFVAAPDQRGYNLSSKPEGVDAYRAKRMVADLAALADALSPVRPFALAGHDWGASVAYAYAFKHPARLTHLVIANGVHPWCFQNAIHTDPEQREASQYINRLRHASADARLAEEGYRRTLRMIEGFSDAAWMTDEVRQGYREAWSRPGAMTAMLNWYRASPIDVPSPGETIAPGKISAMSADGLRVRMPHLLLWGEADRALRPSCIRPLDGFCEALTVEAVAGAGHWILHEEPERVARSMRRFLTSQPD